MDRLDTEALVAEATGFDGAVAVLHRAVVAPRQSRAATGTERIDIRSPSTTL